MMTRSRHKRLCERLGTFFGLFANPVRMKIFCCLQHGPQSVSYIAREAGITLPNTSQHLRRMRQLGLSVVFIPQEMPLWPDTKIRGPHGDRGRVDNPLAHQGFSALYIALPHIR